MNAERWRQVEELLEAALEREPAERGPLLERACASDAELRREVESLLVHSAPSEDFIETPAFVFAADLIAGLPHEQLENRQLGPYKILRELGRGGMGSVFLAERSDGVFQRQVALKLVRRGFADPDLTRRFRRERQILASLNHPNIARLLDGGVSADGEPFPDRLLKDTQEAEDVARLRACARVVMKRLAVAQFGGKNFTLHGAVHQFEAKLIERALDEAGGSITKAARLLGISHQTLDSILNKRHRPLARKRKPPQRRLKSIITKDA